MPQSRTHQDPEQLSRPTVAEDVTRNAHGESLDDAREAFRAEWQAQIERKRQQAKGAAEGALFFHQASCVILGGAAALGALFGCLPGFQWGGLSAALAMSVISALLAVLLALVPAGAAFACAWLLCEKADRLKREAEELERS